MNPNGLGTPYVGAGPEAVPPGAYSPGIRPTAGTAGESRPGDKALFVGGPWDGQVVRFLREVPTHYTVPDFPPRTFQEAPPSGLVPAVTYRRQYFGLMDAKRFPLIQIMVPEGVAVVDALPAAFEKMLTRAVSERVM